MIRQIMAIDGDRLDLICWKHYGSLDGRIVEQVLEANPGISLTTELFAGQMVFLPIINTSSQLERSLW